MNEPLLLNLHFSRSSTIQSTYSSYKYGSSTKHSAVCSYLQDLAGPFNHYHFHTAPGVTHDAQVLMEYATSPAAAGKRPRIENYRSINKIKRQKLVAVHQE
jgi:hypothetical protein